MKNGIPIIQRIKFIAYATAVFGVLHLVSCSASHRLQRILKNHPQLAQSKVVDSIVIREGKSIDTQVVFKETHDTIQYGGLSIFRIGDTIRIFGRTEPCTTIIRRQYTTIEGDKKQRGTNGRNRWQKDVSKKAEKRQNGLYRIALILSVTLNILFILKRLLSR